MKRNVRNCLLKEAREVAVVTLVGRLFHAQAAVKQKDRSPMVRSRVLGSDDQTLLRAGHTYKNIHINKLI